MVLITIVIFLSEKIAICLMLKAIQALTNWLQYKSLSEVWLIFCCFYWILHQLIKFYMFYICIYNYVKLPV